MMPRRQRQRGQVTVETAILFAFVIAALVGMAIYVQRAVSGGVKQNSDSFGTQFSANKGWSSVTTSNTTETQNTITSNQNTKYNQTL